MKSRPILFSGSMITAIDAGRKSQTRRLVVLPRIPWTADEIVSITHTGHVVWSARHKDLAPFEFLFRCPVGEVGDTLWVREAWRAGEMYDARPPSKIPPGAPVWYDRGPQPDLAVTKLGRRRPGMFMPRWMSRFELLITEIRAERLQQISLADAAAEGVVVEPTRGHYNCAGDRYLLPLLEAYRDLWDTLNADRASWWSNPWVWVYTFKKLLPAGDAATPAGGARHDIEGDTTP